jgi:hypothetical protein
MMESGGAALLDSGGRRNVPGQEFGKAVDWMIRNAREHVAQIGFRVQVIEFCGANQTVERGGAFAAGVRTRE